MEEIGNRNSTCRAAAARNCCRSVVRRCRGANWRRRRCLLIVFQLKINSYSDGIGTSPATAPDQTPVFTIFEKVSNSISNQQLSAVSNCCCCCSLSLSLAFVLSLLLAPKAHLADLQLQVQSLQALQKIPNLLLQKSSDSAELLHAQPSYKRQPGRQ